MSFCYAAFHVATSAESLFVETPFAELRSNDAIHVKAASTNSQTSNVAHQTTA